MLPSRGLRPHQIVPLVPRHALYTNPGASRKFSSVPLRTGLSTLPCRTNPLHSARWRTGTGATPNAAISAPSARYASWYAPWSWIPPPNDAGLAKPTPSELAPEYVKPPVEAIHEPVVTSTTPEMAPAGIDKSAVVDGSPSFETVEQLLDAEPKAIADAAVDPTMAAVTYWGQLKDMGLDYGWGPTAFFENLIELSYLNTGLGWAGCIGLSTIAIRTALFYFQVQGSNAGAQLAALKPALQPIMDEMEAAKRRGDDERANALKLKQQAVMGEMGGSLYKSFLTPVMQGVFGYGAFRCLRGMTNLPVAGMETEGYAWFSDLTIADPLYILPAATGAIMFGIMKLGGETGMNTEVQVTSFQKQMMYLGPTVMTAFAAFQPAALQLYFVWSTLLGMVSAVLLKTPAVRRMLGLRLLPSKESNALYSKVVKGQIDLKEFRDPRTGKIRYEAPTATGPSSANKPASASSKPAPAPRHVVRLKQGTTLPPHMRRAAPAKVPQNFADRDLDYDQGTKDLGFADKLNYVARNYKPVFVWRRIKRWYMNDNRPWEVIMAEQKKKKAEHRAKQDELEKQRRLQR